MSTTLVNNNIPTNDGRANIYSLQAVVTENSTNIENNTSNISVSVSLRGSWEPSYYGYTTTTVLQVDGIDVKYQDSGEQIGQEYTQILTYSGNVAHSADGTKTINISVYLSTSGSSGYLPCSGTYEIGSVQLTALPRASEINRASEFLIENGFSVGIDKKSDAFTDTLKINIGRETVKVIQGYANNQVITFSASERKSAYRALNGSLSGTATFEIYTYSGNALIGSDSATTTAAVSGKSNMANIQNFNIEDNIPVTITKTFSEYIDDLTIYRNGEVIKTIQNYVNSNIKLTNNEILNIYNTYGINKTGTLVFTVTTYTEDRILNLGSTTKNGIGDIGGTLYIKSSGAYKPAAIWTNVDGVWKMGIANIKTGNAWKRGI